MQILKQITDEERTSLTVTLTSAELEHYLQQSFEMIAERYGINATSDEDLTSELTQRVGKEEAEKLLGDLVMNISAPFAISEEHINMISSPLFFPEKPVKQGEPFTYAMSILTTPVLSLSSYEPLEIAIPSDLEDEDREVFLHSAVTTAIAERLSTQISDEIYEVTIDDLYKTMEQDLLSQGTTLEEYVKQQGDAQQFHMMVMLHAREQLKQSFALDALAEHLNISVTEDDYLAACEEIAPGEAVQVQQSFTQSGRLFALEQIAKRMLARKWLIETAHYTS